MHNVIKPNKKTCCSDDESVQGLDQIFTKIWSVTNIFIKNHLCQKIENQIWSEIFPKTMKKPGLGHMDFLN